MRGAYRGSSCPVDDFGSNTCQHVAWGWVFSERQASITVELAGHCEDLFCEDNTAVIVVVNFVFSERIGAVTV